MIFFLFLSSTTVNVISVNIDESYYEEIFENKEKIHIIPISNLRTLFLTINLKSWERQSKRYQRRTVTYVDDEESEYFSYWAKSSFQIGLPDQHFVTQITPKGHLYTGSAELQFFAGKNLDPINQRIWILTKGYLPCINYQIEKNELIFKIQAFQYWLEEKYNSPAINFIKVQVINPTETNKETKFAVGFEYGGGARRPYEIYRFNPLRVFWKYEMNNSYAARNNQIIYLWDTPPSEKLQYLKKTYQKPFHCVNKHKPICLASYDIQLKSNEVKNFTFKMPQYPLPKSNQTALTILENGKYEDYFENMKVFWDELIEQGTIIKVSEDKVVNASKSYLIHNFMCQNNISENELEQVTNRFQFNQFWVTDGYFFSLMYNLYNYEDMANKLLRYTANIQKESGNIISQPGYWKQVGCALAAFGEYVKLTNDTCFAFEILPNVIKAVEWIKKAVMKDRFGLMPFANTKDGPFLVGHYTGHNFWALLGIYDAIAVAKAAGENQIAEDFQLFYNAYREHFFKQLRIASERNNGIIPPGMDVIGYVHWEDLLATYRDNLLDPYDPLVNNTFKHYRENHMNEGVSTHGNSLHGWHTFNTAITALRREEQENVLSDFYSMLLHTGSCHEGFEYAVFPPYRDYSTRASLLLCFLIKTIPIWINYPCNGRFAACINILLRMMLIREDYQNLHLFSTISPEWVKPGNVIEINDAPTYYGTVNLTAKAVENGLNISFDPIWNEPPESVQLNLPFFANVSSVLIDGCPVSYDEGFVELPVKSCNVNISWVIDTSIDYSYEKAVEDYTEEYKIQCSLTNNT